MTCARAQAGSPSSAGSVRIAAKRQVRKRSPLVDKNPSQADKNPSQGWPRLTSSQNSRGSYHRQEKVHGRAMETESEVHFSASREGRIRAVTGGADYEVEAEQSSSRGVIIGR